MCNLKMHVLILAVVVHVAVVTTAVTITDGPSDMMIDQGSRLRLSCYIDGLFDNQDVVWQKDNESISSGHNLIGDRFAVDRKRYEILGGRNEGFFDLKIMNIVRTDDGEYQCLVFNRTEGNVTVVSAESRVAKVTVYYTPLPKYPHCPFGKGGRELMAGERMTACVSEIGRPPVLLELQGNYDDMPSTEMEYLPAPEFAVLSMIVSKSDQGRTYTCRARSADFPFYTSTCSLGPLRVVYPPRVAIRPEQAVLSSGEKAVFKCDIESNPAPHRIVWSFVPPLDASRYRLQDNNQTFTIMKLKDIDDNRLLVCAVDNGKDNSSSRRVLVLSNTHGHRDDTSKNRFHFSLTGCSEANTVILACLAAMIVLVTILISVACCRCVACASRKSKRSSRRRIALMKDRRRVDPIDATYTMSSDDTHLIINGT